MRVKIYKEAVSSFDAAVIPFAEEQVLTVALPEEISAPVKAALSKGSLKASCGSVYDMNLFVDGSFKKVVMVSLGDGSASSREVFLAMAKALKSCKDASAAVTEIFLDNAAEITNIPEMAKKILELPHLIAYQFNFYRSVPVVNGMEEAAVVTSAAGMERLAEEAAHVAESTLLARDLVNHPSMYMSPEQLARECEALARELGIEVQIYDKKQAEELKMGAFLAVGRGSVAEPRLIVLRYKGGQEGEAPVALVGKGIMFDSGGYSLKSRMETMHDDMGGAAAVIGAIRAIALEKLPVNVTAVVAACKNMISGDAYVPGDILFSMNGKKIEMLNSDAEGRLTLADALTYAIRKENAGSIIDIATLTGAAQGALGVKTAAVFSNDEELYAEMEEASERACEKIWRLPLDQELHVVIDSEVADIQNSAQGSTMGGGAIVAGLFLQEFVEDHSWIHVDCAPVNWEPKGNDYSIKGATGYGVSLLYETVKVMTE